MGCTLAKSSLYRALRGAARAAACVRYAADPDSGAGCALALTGASARGSTDMGTLPPGVAILTVRSTSPGGVGRDALGAGLVDALREASGVRGVGGVRPGIGMGWVSRAPRGCVTFCHMRESGSRLRGPAGSRDLEREWMFPAPPRPEFSNASVCGVCCSGGGLCVALMFARPPRPVECLRGGQYGSCARGRGGGTHRPSSEKGP